MYLRTGVWDMQTLLYGAFLVLIADYLVREHAKTDGKTSKQ